MSRYFVYTGSYDTPHVDVTNDSGLFVDNDRNIVHEHKNVYKELSVGEATAMRMRGVKFFISADVGGDE